MKRITVKITLFFILFAGSIPNTYGLQDQNTRSMNAFIAKHARQSRGEEYKEARKVISGDLTHDGVAETVVLYTIEGQNGGNNHVQYLAIFAPGKTGLVVVTYVDVGGKLSRSVELTSVDNNLIQLATLSYAPDDGACCPSIKGTTQYKLVKKTLREQKSETK
jgi:hypothetical protein